MSHLWSRRWSSILILNHTVVQLWWHCNNHVIKVWVEVSSLWNIKTERWIVVITSHQVVDVVDKTWLMRLSLREIGRPDTQVGLLCLMDSHVWSPHSVMNDSLSEVPLLEEVTLIFLMTWMDLWKELHSIHELSLLETLLNKQIVFLVHSTVASLAGSLENLESSSESCRVESIPAKLGWPMAVTVVHTNGVDLLFVTLDTMWSTNVISEQPGFSFLTSNNRSQSHLEIGNRLLESRQFHFLS